jgi:hypothetical protein
VANSNRSTFSSDTFRSKQQKDTGAVRNAYFGAINDRTIELESNPFIHISMQVEPNPNSGRAGYYCPSPFLNILTSMAFASAW